MDHLKSSTIINQIMDMDLNDNIAVKSVIDIITSHPFKSAFFLGNLLATSMHQNLEIERTIFCHHNAYTEDDLYAYIFKVAGGLGFLVNIIESRNGKLRHGLPFESYGIICEVEEIPIPPVGYKGIEELVRIDVHIVNSFTVKKIVLPSHKIADGRFFHVPDFDLNIVITSLHRRKEGYKAIDELTCYNHDDYNIFDDLNDTFENKILNYIHQLQRNIQNVGVLKTFVVNMMVGVNVHYPFDRNGENIVAIQSPIDDTIFMIAFDHISKPTKKEQHIALEANMNNLLAHCIPDYTFDANKRNVVLLAITYNTAFQPHFDSVDNIVSLRHDPEDEEFKLIFESYANTISLRDRCRFVILKNKHLMTNQIKDLPLTLQSFIWSSNWIGRQTSIRVT